MRSHQDARWLFFDMGNTLVSEEASTACRIQRLAEAFDRHGASRPVEAIESAFKEASEEFAPRLVSKAIQKLTDDLELRKLIQTEAPYPKELEVPYDGAIETLRLLSSRYKIGVIANQSLAARSG